MARAGKVVMAPETAQSMEALGPAAAEILRLRQQLAAREEVIRQLNRQILENPGVDFRDESEPDQDLLAQALANGRAVEFELQRLREVVAANDTEIAALRRQLGVYERFGARKAIGGALKARNLLRRMGGRS
jgi:hypothetical protein